MNATILGAARLTSTSLALAGLAGALVAAPLSPRQSGLTISSGESVLYDTANGPLVLDGLVIEAGASVRVIGTRPLFVLSHGPVVIDGVLDLSGFDARDVATLNTGNQPEPGAAGAAAGGAGGTGSLVTTTSTPAGGDGFARRAGAGGRGGESGYSASSVPDHRRPGGGGGGALAADQPVHPDPNDPSNAGLIAEAGGDGAAQALGALSGTAPPRGGLAGAAVFVDGDPTNDFWGVKLDPATGAVIRGELAYPVPGAGGGAGGDAIPSAVFPPQSWSPSSDEKGAGGGGGGGLGFLIAPTISVGPSGAIHADGGDGAFGENTFFLDRIGGSSGGGSGGFLVLQAVTLDLSRASAGSLTALGGLGAKASFSSGARTAGGNGGPGVIQLHVAERGKLLLPPGTSVADLASPTPHVLQPVGSVLPGTR